MSHAMRQATRHLSLVFAVGAALLMASIDIYTQSLQLAPSDYTEIEALYARNTIGFDSTADDGQMYADTFTEDGALVRPSGSVSGRSALAALAAANTPALRQWVSNLLIEPAPGGARGWAYVVFVNVSANGAAGKEIEGGLYRDELVKTAAGWRFKTRTYAPGHRMPDDGLLPPAR